MIRALSFAMFCIAENEKKKIFNKMNRREKKDETPTVNVYLISLYYHFGINFIENHFILLTRSTH